MTSEPNSEEVLLDVQDLHVSASASKRHASLRAVSGVLF